MFDRSILFVGAEGVGVGLLAEALAQDYARQAGAGNYTHSMHSSALPLRIYSATTRETAQTDSVMLRAIERLKLDTNGLSLKPLALYTFAGAPRIDHVVMLGAELTPASRLALGEGVDVRTWDITLPSTQSAAPGSRYIDYVRLADSLRAPVKALVDELTALDGVELQTLANSA